VIMTMEAIEPPALAERDNAPTPTGARTTGIGSSVPLAVFAINNASSTLGNGLTPFVIHRDAYPRLPLSAATDGGTGGESPAHYARRMPVLDSEMERTVRELLAAAQQERKAKLDAGRIDTVFQVGGRVLLRTKELLDAADIGKLRPRWDGPFTVTACPSPNPYTLALPRRMLCQPDSQRRPAQALP
jgi:hypothetical protein